MFNVNAAAEATDPNTMNVRLKDMHMRVKRMSANLVKPELNYTDVNPLDDLMSVCTELGTMETNYAVMFTSQLTDSELEDMLAGLRVFYGPLIQTLFDTTGYVKDEQPVKIGGAYLHGELKLRKVFDNIGVNIRE